MSSSLIHSSHSIAPQRQFSTPTPPTPTPPTPTPSTPPSLRSTINGEISEPTCWEKALASLDENHRKFLTDFNTEAVGDFGNEIQSVRKLGDTHTNKLSKGPTGAQIMTRARVNGILQKMEEFAKIGDIAVKASPAVVSLVWMGVRLCLQVCGCPPPPICSLYYYIAYRIIACCS